MQDDYRITDSNLTICSECGSLLVDERNTEDPTLTSSVQRHHEWHKWLNGILLPN